MKSSLNRNLIIGFGISVIILVISSIASLVSISNLLSSAREVTHSNLVSSQVDDILTTMVDAETGQRGFLLTNDELFLEPYNGSFNKATAILESVKELTNDNPSQHNNIEALHGMIERRFFLLGQLINQKRNGEEVSIASLRNGKAFMDSIRTFVKLIKTNEKDLLQQRTESMDKFAASTPLFIIIAALISLLITIIFYLKVRKDVSLKK